MTSTLSVLGETAELARCFFEESNDGLFVFDPTDLRLLEANPSGQRLTGRSRRELLSTQLSDLIHTHQRAALDDLVAACQSTSVFHSREGFLLQRKSGDPLDVNISVSRLHVKPSPLGLLVVRDVSKRKLAERELERQKERLEYVVGQRTNHLELVNLQLREEISDRQRAESHLRDSQAKFNQMANSINEVVYLMSPDWSEAMYVSPAFEKIWGIGLKQIYEDGRCFLRRVHPDDREEMEQQMRRRAEGDLQGDREYEFRIVRADGAIRWLRSTVSPIYGSQGEVVRLAGTTEDITERKAAEERLRSSEEQFRQLTEFIDAVFWLRGGSGDEQLYVSPKYETIWGRRMENLADDPDSFLDAILPEDRPKVEEAFQLLRRSGKPEDFDVEYRIRRPDGEVRWIHDRGFSVTNENGELLRQAGFAEDVTERKLVEERQRRHQQELAHVARLSTMGQMVAGIAHEINQPLFSIANYSDACSNVLQNDSSQEQVLEWTEEIKKQSTLAGQIIKRLANFVRNDVPRRASAKIDVLLRDSLELVSFDARSRKVTVRLEAEGAAQTVHVDAVQIQQVVVNLLRNAYESLEANAADNRHVTVLTKRDGRELEVSVCDNGPGLADGIKDKVFEAFLTTKTQGMGMGLAISRSIIESHGGEIQVSTNETGGATFRFRIPIADRD